MDTRKQEEGEDGQSPEAKPSVLSALTAVAKRASARASSGPSADELFKQRLQAEVYFKSRRSLLKEFGLPDLTRLGH